MDRYEVKRQEALNYMRNRRMRVLADLPVKFANNDTYRYAQSPSKETRTK
jgi:hypothetical protein